MIRIQLLAAVLAAGAASGAAVDGAGTQGYAWIRNTQGPRAAAMGGAMSAAAAPLDALYWNPAALAGSLDPAFEIGYLRAFEGVNAAHLSAVRPLANGALGYAMQASSYGDLDEVNETGIATGESFRPYTFAAAAGYAVTLREWRLGATLRALTQGIDEDRSSACAADLGVIWRADSFRAGVSLRHLGFEIDALRDTKESLPLTAALGAAWSQNDWSLGADLDYSESAGTQLRAGGEYIHEQILALRAGYSSLGRSQAFDPSVIDGLSLGAGVLLASGLTFQYAATFQGDLGVAQRASMGYDFR